MQLRHPMIFTTLILLSSLMPGTASADGDDDGPQVRFVPWATPNFQLQTWLTAWDADEDPQADPGGYGDPEHDIGFSIPRARIGLSGGYRMVDYSIRMGTSRPYDAVSPDPANLDLVEAWARASFESKGGVTRLAFGQHYIPFSREMGMSSNDLVFQERAVSSNWLAPIRDIGFSASHRWRWLKIAAGLFNGGGNIWGDSDNGMQIATRLEVEVGGDSYRTNSSENTFGFGAGYIYNKTIATTEQRVNVDMLGRIAGITLFVEGGMNILDPDTEPVILPPGVPERTIRMGGLVQLSYYRDLPIGAIEPAVRFSYLDDARHLKDNGDVGILHGGVTWREPIPFFDIGAGYIHRIEFQGRETNNDSVRVWMGFKYPSRRYAPMDIVGAFRKLGGKPLKG